jgi:hypothetical protein
VGAVPSTTNALRASLTTRENAWKTDLLRTWRLEVFQHQSPLLLIQIGTFGGHDLVDLALGLNNWVNPDDTKTFHSAVQYSSQVGSRFSSAQLHGFAALNKAQCEGCSCERA